MLAAAVLTETLRPELRADPARIPAAIGVDAGGAVGARVRQVPLPGAEDLAERLLLADPEVQLIALAERLDHMRHAHLWPEASARRAAHELTETVYASIAERVHPTLARRYAWWCDMFERKYLG